MELKRAVKSQSRLRLGIVGVSGSGKTFSALAIGCELAKLYGGRLAFLDSERGSSQLYADKFDFDVALIADDQSPDAYTKAIQSINPKTHPVIVIDSWSHAWMGKKGALELVDLFAARSQSGNSFAAWRNVTPKHNEMVDSVVASPCHVIACMRAKSEYVMEKDEKTGKTAPKKIGLAPVMRDGIEYEFTICGDMSLEHQFIVSKTRFSDLADRAFDKPGAEFAQMLHKWLTSGAVETLPPPAVKEPEESALAKAMAREAEAPTPAPKAETPKPAEKPAPAPEKGLSEEEKKAAHEAIEAPAKQPEAPAPQPAPAPAAAPAKPAVPSSVPPAKGDIVTREEIIACLSEYQTLKNLTTKEVKEAFIQIPLQVASLQDVKPADYFKILSAMFKDGYQSDKDGLPPVFKAIFDRFVAAKKAKG